MDDMEDYRVADWLENGLLKRIRSRFSSVAIASVIVGSAVGLGSVNASNLDPVASPGASSSVAVGQLRAAVSTAPSMVRLRELNRMIEYAAANLDSPDTSDIDPEMLALADSAFEKIDARRSTKS